jgi:branched-chain amino acid transport system ATP-binding protein
VTDRAALLTITDLAVRYGAIPALAGVDLTVGAGEMVSVVGPNGAGKTTLLAAVAGIVRPAAGAITFEGVSLVDCPIEAIVRRGISLVPEGRGVLASLTVLENLKLGATIRRDAAVKDDIEHYLEAFPILGARRHQPAGRLSGGEQQQLVIARALLANPKLLLLDEPSLGLAPTVIDQVYDLLQSLRGRGLSILLVEQNAARALRIADRSYVLNGGRVRLSGRRDEIIAHPDFDAAYFGLAMQSTAAAS